MIRQLKSIDFKSYANTKFIVLTSITVVIMAVLVFMVSPFFRMEQVLIEGTILVNQHEIHERLERTENSNLLLFNTRAARSRIMQNLYIDSVEFRRALPNTLVVTISERRLTAYVQIAPGSFLFLDDTGRVLETRGYFTEPLPILTGLQFTSFQLGEILEVPDPFAFSAVVQYAQLLSQHGLINRVTHMNVADSSNIEILIDNRIVFNVGTSVRADEKIRTIIAILEDMPHADHISGFMDISEIRPEFILEVLW